MKLSVSLFLTDILPHKRKFYHKIVKSKVFDGYSSEHVFQALKKAGIDGIELLLPQFAQTTTKDIQEVKQVLDTNNIAVFSIHQKLRFFTKTRVAEIIHLFHIADMLSAKVIVLHVSNVGKQFHDGSYTELLHSLEKKYGIRIGFENMEKYAGSILSPHRWHHEKFASLMEETDFNITFDTTHLAHSGGDIIAFFKKNKEKIINIHLSDYKHHILNNNLRPLRYKHLPLGKGNLPVEDFLLTLKKAGYEGIITLEISADLSTVCRDAHAIRTIMERS